MRGESDQDGGKEDDPALARRAAEGDARAFRQLIERHYDRVFRLCLGVLCDAAEAEDLTQEIWASLPRRLGSFRGEARFSTWLHRVALNAARDCLRRRAASQKATAAFADIDALRREEGVEAAQKLAWLEEALAGLGVELRETAALVLGDALSHAQAGEILGVAESTVSWRMSEIRKQLRAEARRQEV